MPGFEPKPFRHYRWIVRDPQLLGGMLAIRGTRLSVALILECMANSMSHEDINESFDGSLPAEAVPEVLKVAAELVSSAQVVA
jgi:uncharacterized protein (DUF433 family)